MGTTWVRTVMPAKQMVEMNSDNCIVICIARGKGNGKGTCSTSGRGTCKGTSD